MNRCLKLSVLVALALGSAPVWAITLGQIQVKSALDRPLVADIPLTPDYAGQAKQITVTLAPSAAFARAGISRAALKVPLTFKIVTNAQGQKVIRVTSKEPVRAPFLDFLIQVTWPKGKMLREYTVLLDPLGMMPAPTAAPVRSQPQPPVQPAASVPIPPPPSELPQAVPAPVPAPAPAPAMAPAAPSVPQVTAQPRAYGPVQYGDTLSHIAYADAIDGVSYQQMLIALKAANPDAFFRDNVNALKAGAVLRIPTRAQALKVTRAAAIAAVRKQNATWQASRPSKPTLVAGAGSTAASSGAGAGQAAGSNDHLHLVAPKAGSGNSAGTGGGQQAAIQGLQHDLARSKEALSSQKQQSTDLQSRVTALKGIVQKNKHLLSLKNGEIAALQKKLADARKQAGKPAASASTAASQATATAPVKGAASAASVATVAAASAASTGMAAPAVAGSVAVAGVPAAAAFGGKAGVVSAASVALGASPATATKAPSKHVAAKAKPATPKPAAIHHQAAPATPWYEQMWPKIVLAIIIILLIIWAILGRRKKSDGKRKGSLADRFGDSPLVGAPEAYEQGAADEDADATVVTGGGDDDGEAELLAQLAGHPDDIGLHLELVSLYYAHRDVSQFEGAAEAMHAYVDDDTSPEWQNVVDMGREIDPDHPLFVGNVAASDATREDFADHDADHGTGHELEGEHQTSADELEDIESWHTPTAATDMPSEADFDALPPLPEEQHAGPTPEAAHPAAPEDETYGLDSVSDHETYSDDPVDTKLDLARAYMELGDHDGARAMLEEVLHDGSAAQQDTARKMLDDLG